MSRFYLPPEQCNGNRVLLEGREAHHALHVLRLKPGQQFTVLDGTGGELSCEVDSTARDNLSAVVREKRQHSPSSSAITLLQALPRGKIIESIIQKSTELGVARIVPLLAERVVSDLNEKQSRSKLEKWQLIAIDAIKQCGSPWLPKVEVPATPAEVLGCAEKFDLSLVASLREHRAQPRHHLEAFRAREHRKPGSIAIWIGPEGDFTPAELDSIEQSGALPITLGARVLRSETAAMYALSVLSYELQLAAE